MATLQEQQAPIDKRIVEALIAATPETWNSAEMAVERHQEGKTERMTIVITSPEGHRDVIGATDEIYEALYQLADCFAASGKVWRKVHYWAGLDVNGTWNFRAEFEY